MDDSSTNKAANASWACAIAIFVLGLINLGRGTSEPQLVIGGMCLLLMAAGLLLGVIALYGIFAHGRSGIVRAILGTTCHGILLYCFATGFFAARSAALANASLVPEVCPAAWTPSGANTHGRYRSEGLSFDYANAYDLKTSTNGIVLWNADADSKVVIMCLPKTADMGKALKNCVSGMQKALRDNSCTGFTQTGVEKIDGTIRSGSVIRTEFDKPTEGRFHADVYSLSNGPNYITVMHSYPDQMTTSAGELFATILHSLKDGPGTSPVSGKPATLQAAVPAATPKGPPELTSIMWIPTRPSAQLETSFAFEGDTVRGYKVTKISRDSVDLLTPQGASLKLVLPAQIAGK